mmetsp:Transcript_2710/g.4604  ORF Transcript_2710/g.4604 Transcript_2710/m.4604 type:complete len:140 (-) Transcript_2710:27-446(-)
MKTIVKNTSRFSFLKKQVDTMERSQHQISQNREVLAMYREVLKMTKRFTWNNEDGEPWKDILARAYRQEFEAMRQETDQVKVSKFLLTQRESIQRIHSKVNKATLEMMKHVDESRTDRQGVSQTQKDRVYREEGQGSAK